MSRVFILVSLLLSLSLAGCTTSTSAPAPAAQPTAAPPAATATTPPTAAAPATRPAATAPAPTSAAAAPATTATRPAAQPTSPPTVAVAQPTTAPPAAATAKKLNLNTASAADFLTVPGVGDRMVREFQEYRPYASILQFRRELGKYVNQQQVAEYEKYVYVPIDINRADAATLQQIPGLDATEAEALVAGRPYAAADAFFARLAQVAPDADVAAARAYVSAP